MATLPSSGPLSINDIKNVMGGPASPSMANYYRGGAYVPSTKTVNVRTPSSGDIYTYPSVPYNWWEKLGTGSGGSVYVNGTNYNAGGSNSVTIGSSTYYRGDFKRTVSTCCGTYYLYGYYYITPTTQNINTSVPTSGQISISQFYGAEKP